MISPAITLLVATLLPLPEEPIEYAPADKGDSKGAVLFDWAGKDIFGKDIQIKRAEFVFRVHPFPDPPPPPLVVPTKLPPAIAPPGENRFLYSQLLVSVPLGKYEVRVRCVSTEDVVGQMSNPIFLEVTDEKKPAAPTNLRSDAGE